MSDQFGSFAWCTTWCRDISTEDQESISLPIRWPLQERKDEITFWSRAKRVVPLCHAAASEKKKHWSRSERAVSLCATGCPLTVLVLASFFARRPRERCVSFSRFDINNALQDRKERKTKGDKERAESGSLCCFN